MKQLIKNLFLIACLTLLSNLSHAQGVVATAKLDTNIVVVGQPFVLELSITQPKDIKIDWPYFSDSIGMLEVVKNEGLDTIPVEDNTMLLRSQKVTLMAFDTGIFVIPGFTIDYKVRNTTAKVYTDPLSVKVFLMPVDTTKAIKDIHPIQDVPYDWMFIGLVALGVIALAIIVWLIVRYLKKAKHLDDAAKVIVAPKQSAYKIAMESFDQLKKKEIWQQGDVKLYYSELTEIVRAYIQNRWMIPALEFTSDEILEHAFIKQIDAAENDKLVYLLRLADLVKFAKAVPHMSEHELSFTNAVQFVEATTPFAEKEMSNQKGGEA